MGFWIFKATLSNISVISISWRSPLLVEETKVPGENLSYVTDKLSTPRHERKKNNENIGFRLSSLYITYPHVTVNRSVKTFPYNSHSNWYLYQR